MGFQLVWTLENRDSDHVHIPFYIINIYRSRIWILCLLQFDFNGPKKIIGQDSVLFNYFDIIHYS